MYRSPDYYYMYSHHDWTAKVFSFVPDCGRQAEHFFFLPWAHRGSYSFQFSRSIPGFLFKLLIPLNLWDAFNISDISFFCIVCVCVSLSLWISLSVCLSVSLSLSLFLCLSSLSLFLSLHLSSYSIPNSTLFLPFSIKLSSPSFSTLS